MCARPAGVDPHASPPSSSLALVFFHNLIARAINISPATCRKNSNCCLAVIMQVEQHRRPPVHVATRCARATTRVIAVLALDFCGGGGTGDCRRRRRSRSYERLLIGAYCGPIERVCAQISTTIEPHQSSRRSAQHRDLHSSSIVALDYRRCCLRFNLTKN